MNKVKLTLAALAAAGTLSLTTMAPAYADGAASTRNIILGAAAIAGIAIEANIAQKNAQADAGYLPDGRRVYDGNGDRSFDRFDNGDREHTDWNARNGARDNNGYDRGGNTAGDRGQWDRSRDN